MKFYWKTKRIESFQDEFEEKGLINCEQAVSIFQTYPWEENVKKSLNDGISYSLPTIVFYNEKNEQLEIGTTDLSSFDLFFFNTSHYAQLRISNDFSLNPEGVSVEDFIELFFNGEMQEKVHLEPIPLNETIILENELNVIEYDFNKNSFLKIKISFSIFFFINIFSFFFFFNNEIYSKNLSIALILHIIILLFWLPSIYLFYTYYIKNNNAILKVDSKLNTIEYADRKQNLKFNKRDINFCILFRKVGKESIIHDFKYLRIDLKNGESIWITSLLGNVEKIIESLNLRCKINDSIIPMI